LNRFKIHYVRPGSVAYEAGIQSGDYIMQINDVRRNELNLDNILDIINLREGHHVRVLVSRDGILLRKNFQLREDL
jgi:C-terminal processing protease CtpA/Prc